MPSELHLKNLTVTGSLSANSEVNTGPVESVANSNTGKRWVTNSISDAHICGELAEEGAVDIVGFINHNFDSTATLVSRWFYKSANLTVPTYAEVGGVLSITMTGHGLSVNDWIGVKGLITADGRKYGAIVAQVTNVDNTSVVRVDWPLTGAPTDDGSPIVVGLTLANGGSSSTPFATTNGVMPSTYITTNINAVQWFRFTINDSTTANSALGTLFISSGPTLDVNVSMGYGLGIVQPYTVHNTIGGSTWINAQPARRMITFTYQALSETDALFNMHVDSMNAGLDQAALIRLCPDDDIDDFVTVYGYISSRGMLSRIRTPNNQYSMSYELTEAL